MLANKTPVSIANYTPLGTYIQIPIIIISFLIMRVFNLIDSIQNFEFFILAHQGYFLFIPRLMSALLGTLTILVVYKLTLLMVNVTNHKSAKIVAFIAAFLTAMSFSLVHISHLGRPWSASIFFLVLSIYFTYKKKYIYTFTAMALSFGFHQVGLVIFPFVLFSWLLESSRKSLLGPLIFLTLVGLFSSLTLRSGIINAIERNQSFLKDGTLFRALIAGEFSFPNSLINTVENNLAGYFISSYIFTDGIIFVFGFAGILTLLKLNKQSFSANKQSFSTNKNNLLLILYIVFYFLFASLFFLPSLKYMLPMTLLLIPFAAFGIYNYFRWNKFAIAIILLLASLNSLWWNWLYLKTPTFIQTHNWINSNIDPNTPIAYTGSRQQTFSPSLNAIDHMQSSSPNVYQRLRKFLVFKQRNMDNIRNIIYISNFPGKTKEEKFKNATKNYPVVYVVDYYLDPNDRIYLTDPSHFEIIANFNPVRNRQMFNLPEPLFEASSNFLTYDNNIEISMYQLDRTGPYFDILKVK